MAFSDLDYVKSLSLAWPFWLGLERLVMFRSSVAAFYPLGRRHFYRRGSFQCDRFTLYFLRQHSRSQVKKIVYRMSEILFVAEIAFSRLDRCVSQQELNLLKLATAAVAQRRTGSPQVMRCYVLQTTPSQQVLTTYHTTFCEMPFPHTFPFLATARKILPSVTPAATVH